MEVSVPTEKRNCEELEVPVPTEKIGGSSPQRKRKGKGLGKVKGIETKEGERKPKKVKGGREEPLGLELLSQP